jgi:hypothetical protein
MMKWFPYAALWAAFFFIIFKKMASIGLRLIALYIGFFYDIGKRRVERG